MLTQSHAKYFKCIFQVQRDPLLQGNCTDLPAPTHGSLGLLASSAPLRSLKPHQCVILSDNSPFQVSFADLWIENVYVRMVTPSSGALDPLLTAERSSVWMTNVTLQGDGDKSTDCTLCGFSAFGSSKLYAEGVLILIPCCHIFLPVCPEI